jgi:hypothetical protein
MMLVADGRPDSAGSNGLRVFEASMRTLAAAVMVAWVFSIGPGPAAAAEKVVLITADEAARPSQPVDTLNRRGITRGPKIVLVSPATDVGNKSPVHLNFKFESFGGARIDTKDVRVLYLKKPAVDLTDRIKPYLGAAGFDIEQAEIPPGDHVIRVDVKDSVGHSSTALFTISVVQ